MNYFRVLLFSCALTMIFSGGMLFGFLFGVSVEEAKITYVVSCEDGAWYQDAPQEEPTFLIPNTDNPIIEM